MSKKKTQDEYEKELKEIHPHLTVIGEYVSARKLIEIKCEKHNYIFTTIAGSVFKSAYGCKLCAREQWGITRRNKMINGGFVEKLSAVNPNIIPLEEYQYSREKIKVQCKVCGHVWYSYPYSLLDGNGCKPCAMRYVQKLRIKTHEDFLNDLKQRNPNYDKIRFLTKYKMYESPILCECLECNEIWESTPHNLLSGSACCACNLSKGEGKIRQFLKDNNIKYEPQKQFDGLLGCGGKNLRFDFYLPDNRILIEYQGEYHDNSVPSQTKDEFERLCEHDRRKKIFAQNNNYKLLEIWYKDFDNIELILRNQLLGEKSNG